MYCNGSLGSYIKSLFNVLAIIGVSAVATVGSFLLKPYKEVLILPVFSHTFISIGETTFGTLGVVCL
jgi:hypothetical protein